MPENQRRRELEQGFNNVQTRRKIRIRQLRDVAEDYLGDYRLRFRGVTFAEYAIGHVVRHLGEKLLIDIDETTVLAYQTARLKEQASPKSINEEVRFLLTMMGESGDVKAQRPGVLYSSSCLRSAWKGLPRSPAIAHPRLSRILRLKSCRASVLRCSGRAEETKTAMCSTAERTSTSRGVGMSSCIVRSP